MSGFLASVDGCDDAARDAIALLRALNAEDDEGAAAILGGADLALVARTLADTALVCARHLALVTGTPQDDVPPTLDRLLGEILGEAQTPGFSAPG